MKKSLLFIVIIIILIVAGVVIYKSSTKKEKSPETTMSEALKGKKIAMIIAFRDFRDAEYFIPKEIFEKVGAKITTVSTKMGTAIGADGGDTEVDLLVENLNPAEFADLQSKSSHDSIQSISSFDAIVFIGGPGCLQYLDNENSYKVARETVEQNKVLGSICVSPVILAKAGVLKGKKATVWSSSLDKGPVKILKENGAIYEDKNVIVDGKIITGNGPDAAEEFGKKLVEVLTSK